jgi:prophage DNA circulation protein
MAATLAMAGCNKQGGIDTAGFESSFKSADAAVQPTVEKVVTAVKGADYSGAMTELKTLASNAKLTPDQQQAIKDLMAQVQKAVTDAAGKAAGDATKAVKDMPNALPK